ncbi:hypothetical protein CDAR_307731 [Caerostris darwini]|uniref:Uncharacterized protein n=1 Tax=Caerostris darwini TaxID=1538125 RepID=A0AAV4WGJ3_9ARAC|nr:hypothetical protein CDAR_307731 [Caerostris darwini]
MKGANGWKNGRRGFIPDLSIHARNKNTSDSGAIDGWPDRWNTILPRLDTRLSTKGYRSGGLIDERSGRWILSGQRLTTVSNSRISAASSILLTQSIG